MKDMLVARIDIEEILKKTPVKKALRGYDFSREERNRILNVESNSSQISSNEMKWYTFRDILKEHNPIYGDVGYLAMGILEDIQLGYSMIEEEDIMENLMSGKAISFEGIEFLKYTIVPVRRDEKIVAVDIAFDADLEASVVNKEVKIIEDYLGIELSLSNK